jgi:hypothetical protein
MTFLGLVIVERNKWNSRGLLWQIINYINLIFVMNFIRNNLKVNFSKIILLCYIE